MGNRIYHSILTLYSGFSFCHRKRSLKKHWSERIAAYSSASCKVFAFCLFPPSLLNKINWKWWSLYGVHLVHWLTGYVAFWCSESMLRRHRRNTCQLKLLVCNKSGTKIIPWHTSGAENFIFMITLLYNNAACKREEGKVFCCCHCKGTPSLSGPNRRDSVRIGEERSKELYPFQWWSSKCTPAQPSHWLLDVFVYVDSFIFLYLIHLYIYVLIHMCSYTYMKLLSSPSHWIYLSIIPIASFFLFCNYFISFIKGDRPQKAMGDIASWPHWGKHNNLRIPAGLP